MPYDRERHHRRSVRLRSYDYASAGAYFVTLCAQHRACLFGEIIAGEVRLSGGGLALIHWWDELLLHFPTVDTDAWVVMPNHFHGIIVLHGRPAAGDDRAGPTLGHVVAWFKTMTTNTYIQAVKMHGWPSFPGKLWQRSFYDRVVRDDRDLARIRQYIADNPARWASDEEHPDNRQPRRS